MTMQYYYDRIHEVYEHSYRVYEAIIESTSSELILFFIIMAVFISPLYIVMMRDRKYSRKHESEKHNTYLEREREIIAVIKENSAAITANTTVMTSLRAFLEAANADTKHAFVRLHERMDIILNDTTHIKTVLSADRQNRQALEANQDENKHKSCK